MALMTGSPAAGTSGGLQQTLYPGGQQQATPISGGMGQSMVSGGLNLPSWAPQSIDPSLITPSAGAIAGDATYNQYFGGPQGYSYPGLAPGLNFSTNPNDLTYPGSAYMVGTYGTDTTGPSMVYYGANGQPLNVQSTAASPNTFMTGLTGALGALALPAAGALGAFSGLDAAAGGAAAGGAAGGAAPLTYASVPGSFGGAAGAPVAGEVGAGMGSALPGTIPTVTAGTDAASAVAGAGGFVGPPAELAGAGGAAGIAGDIAGPPAWAAGTGAAGGLAGALGGSAGSAASGIGGIIGKLLGNNPVGSLGSLAGSLTNIFKNPGNNIIQPYNIAQGNAQPAIQSLLQMMDPNNFYNSAVGQNLQSAKVRDINAQQAAGGRFGLGPGGTIPQNGQGIDAANILNQYMAQEWQKSLAAMSGAVSPLIGGVNATLPNQIGGNIINANNMNPLNSIFQNPIVDNLGNSALKYLWGGQENSLLGGP